MTQYKLVPVEPTEEMMRAMTDPFFPVNGDTRQAFGPAYRAMLAAAPEVSAEPVLWEVLDGAVRYGAFYCKENADNFASAQQRRFKGHGIASSFRVVPLYDHPLAPQTAAPDVAQKLAEALAVISENYSLLQYDLEKARAALAAYEQEVGR